MAIDTGLVHGPHLEAVGIAKRFGGIAALNDISIAIQRDNFHALVGENGAGKSTLGRIFAGLMRPSAGTIRVGGEAVRFGGPRDALANGITMVVQERAIVPKMSVIENVLLNREIAPFGLVNRRRNQRRFDDICDLAGFELDPRATAGSLRPAEQLRVEILRALARDAEILVLDEVTAALAPDETQAFFELLRQLRSRHRTIIYITHFLAEVIEFADTVSILKEGRLVRTSRTGDETTSSLVSGMLGRPLESVYPPKVAERISRGTPALAVRGLSCRGVDNVSLEIQSGEIVALAGLVGSGRTEIARAIFGADKRTAGEIFVDGRSVSNSSPQEAIRQHMALVPESRQHEGLVLRHSIRNNMTLVHLAKVSRWGFLMPDLEARRVKELIGKFDIRAGSVTLPLSALSGGNQQKVLFSKWFLDEPRVLIADEPTRGVDIGAKHAIYQIINDLASKGAAILLISSELEEALNIAHRVLVVRKGKIVSELQADASQREAVLRAAFGTVHSDIRKADNGAQN